MLYPSLSPDAHGFKFTVDITLFCFYFIFRYGAVLENLQSRADIVERIKGCIVDSAPVLEIRPEVCISCLK